MGSLVVYRLDAVPAADLAFASRRVALDGPITADAELVVAVPRDEAIVLGAFQRACDVADRDAPLVRRGSGGAAARVGPGSVWIQLAMKDARIAPEKILNRLVRPLLRGMTKAGATARYFGRDWVSVDHRPAALVAFAHDSRSDALVFEAIVAAKTSFAVGARASFMGKEPLAVGKTPRAIADAVAAEYAALGDPVVPTSGFRLAPAPDAGVADDPPWTATHDEAMGPIHAGRDREGTLRLGGELIASHDAVARLEARIATLAPDAFGAAVDEAFAAPGVALFGVRSLESIRDVLVRAAQ
ncbi:MAG TPA: hypothetical protein VIF62_07205 [Labilithrix sp.]